MNDEQLRAVLTAADRPVQPPAEVSERVHADMATELDRLAQRVTPDDANLVDVSPLTTRESTAMTRRRRRWPAAAALILIVAGAVGVTLSRPGDLVEPAPTSRTAMSEPPAYLRACLELRTSTRPDAARWQDVLADLDPATQAGRTYLDDLATELTALARTSTAESAAPQLAAAAAAATTTRDQPDLTALLAMLDDLAAQLVALAGIGCL